MAIKKGQIEDNSGNVLHPETEASLVVSSSGNVQTDIDSLNQKSFRYATTAGSANVYTLAVSPAPSSLFDGLIIGAKINVVNTGASTINVNGLGAKAIVDASGNAIPSGALKVNIPYSFVYNGTSFVLQGKDFPTGVLEANSNSDMVDGHHASDFSLTSHTHDKIVGSNSNMVRADNVNDYAGLDKTNNVDIKSWYGVSFSNACTSTGVQGTPSVSIDARTGNIATVGALKTQSGKQGLIVGDDATIGDHDVANCISIQGQQNSAIGGISFGSNKDVTLLSNNDGLLYVNGKKLLNTDDYNSLFQSASNGKSSIANAITGIGGTADSGMTFDQLAAAISTGKLYKVFSGSCDNFREGSSTPPVNFGKRPAMVWFHCGVYHWDTNSYTSSVNGLYADNGILSSAGIDNNNISSGGNMTVSITDTGFTYSHNGGSYLLEYRGIQWQALCL
jgi:hypothetical protein